MTTIRPKLALAAVGAIAVGAGAGTIINAGAASPSKPQAAARTAKAKHGGRAGRKGRARLIGRAVHGELTVPAGGKLVTVTLDRGMLKAVDGSKLTITEGTKKVAGKDVTVTVPAGAKVLDDRKAASLGDLKAGQHVAVITLPKRTVVRAVTPKHG